MSTPFSTFRCLGCGHSGGEWCPPEQSFYMRPDGSRKPIRATSVWCNTCAQLTFAESLFSAKSKAPTEFRQRATPPRCLRCGSHDFVPFNFTETGDPYHLQQSIPLPLVHGGCGGRIVVQSDTHANLFAAGPFIALYDVDGALLKLVANVPLIMRLTSSPLNIAETLIFHAKYYGRFIEHKTRIFKIGRHADCEIIVDAPCVSRRHCVVGTGEQGVWVHDLNSTNGTAVERNRHAIPLAGPFNLCNADTLVLGHRAPSPVRLSVEIVFQGEEVSRSVAGYPEAGSGAR
jgi:hypothetical protein